MLLNGDEISEARAEREFELRRNLVRSEKYAMIIDELYAKRRSSIILEKIMQMVGKKDRRETISMIGYLKKRGFDIENQEKNGSGKSPRYKLVGFKPVPNTKIQVDKEPLNPVLHPLIEKVFC